MKYLYGMKYRPFGLGCQPLNGLIAREDDAENKYWDILIYDRKLTEGEVKEYELELITATTEAGTI